MFSKNLVSKSFYQGGNVLKIISINNYFTTSNTILKKNSSAKVHMGQKDQDGYYAEKSLKSHLIFNLGA